MRISYIEKLKEMIHWEPMKITLNRVRKVERIIFIPLYLNTYSHHLYTSIFKIHTDIVGNKEFNRKFLESRMFL